jgi:DNA-binding CsgD family transcriptional regulator
MLDASHAGIAPLIGRTSEMRTLTALLEGIEAGKGALVLRGEPGIGKSRLLAEVAAIAQARGIAVLAAAGVQSETEIAFSGLHQLLRPIRGRAENLPPGQRAALDAAFGVSGDEAPELFQIAMATLDLVADSAAMTPTLLVVDDAHWVDEPSAAALAFVARRLEAEPAVLLVAVRDGFPSPFVDGGQPELHLAALDADASNLLLDHYSDGLRSAARRRLLGEASGNPLALIELPLGALGRDREAASAALPLTERLEQAFAARIADLPRDTQVLVLIASLHDDDGVDEILQAGSLVAGRPLPIALLQPAADAAIVELDVNTVRFRHPLVRSAVSQSTDVPLRRAAHEALAEVLADEPERAVWHRAALISGTHEDVAAQLEAAAQMARRRGATAVALTAMGRAAELSAAVEQPRRLLAAALFAFELGAPETVAALLREVNALDPSPPDRARALWIEEVSRAGPIPDGDRVPELIAAAERAGASGDRDLHADLLWLVASRAWWVQAEPRIQEQIVAAAHRLGRPDDGDPRLLAIHAYADSAAQAVPVITALRAAAAGPARDADSARYLGHGAIVIGAFDLAADFCADAEEGLRETGRLGHLPAVLTLRSMVTAWLGEWEVALPAAAEARRLATELGQPLWSAGADIAESTIAGIRGDAQTAEATAARAEAVLVPLRANHLVAMCQGARMLAANGAARHAEAFASAERLFTPNDPAHHRHMAFLHMAEYAEAALHAGRSEDGRRRLREVEEAVARWPSMWIQLGVRHARALLAESADEAEARFQEAFAALPARAPFYRARLSFAYGQWLRRQRRIADSRAPLRSARDAFDALGCASWGDQARRELRASGESSRRRDPAARDELTAQELQIAQLAAEGLTNREIGARLYLSHRTIGTHLYRIFPKLGITTRGELAGALASPSVTRE